MKQDDLFQIEANSLLVLPKEMPIFFYNWNGNRLKKACWNQKYFSDSWQNFTNLGLRGRCRDKCAKFWFLLSVLTIKKRAYKALYNWIKAEKIKTNADKTRSDLNITRWMNYWWSRSLWSYVVGHAKTH